jgi:hypothetical protein
MRSRRWTGANGVCSRSTSSSCGPIRRAGLSEATTSCGTYASWAPQSARRSFLGSRIRSCPPKLTEPPRSTEFPSRHPIAALANVLLPLPDSPASPTTVPGKSSSETAWTTVVTFLFRSR